MTIRNWWLPWNKTWMYCVILPCELLWENCEFSAENICRFSLYFTQVFWRERVTVIEIFSTLRTGFNIHLKGDFTNCNKIILMGGRGGGQVWSFLINKRALRISQISPLPVRIKVDFTPPPPRASIRWFNPSKFCVWTISNGF